MRGIFTEGTEGSEGKIGESLKWMRIDANIHPLSLETTDLQDLEIPTLNLCEYLRREARLSKTAMERSGMANLWMVFVLQFG